MKNLIKKLLFAAFAVVSSLSIVMMLSTAQAQSPQLNSSEVSFYLTQEGNVLSYRAAGNQVVEPNHMLWFAHLDNEAAARNPLYQEIKANMLSAGGRVHIEQRYGRRHGEVVSVRQAWTLQEATTGKPLQVMYVEYMKGTRESGMSVRIQCVMTDYAMKCPRYLAT